MTGHAVVHVIDDDDAARDALAFLLAAANYLVRAYESARSFLDAIPATEAGCVVTDVRMPEINGLDLLRLLKRQGIEWPVIVITGEADVPIAIEAIKVGAVDFIEKPYDADVLLGAVKFALGGPANDARRARRIEIERKLASLSVPERQVLEALADGRANNSIARDLGLSVRIVEVHRANVMMTMQATSLSHLVRMMLLTGP